MSLRPTLWLSLSALLLAALACAPLAAATPDAIPTLALGVDYEQVADGKPLEPLAGKVEVVEIFSYGCHHCATFQPILNAWKRKQSQDVRLTYLPAAYDLDDPFARAFYAAKDKGLLSRSHDALFEAVNRDISLPRNPTTDEVAAFFTRYGVAAPAFASAMQASAVDASLQRARDFAVASGLSGTPALVINGRYRVLGNSFEDMLRIADLLIAHERSARR